MDFLLTVLVTVVVIFLINLDTRRTFKRIRKENDEIRKSGKDIWI